MRQRLFAALLCVLVSTACRSHPGPAQWDAHVQRFLDDYFRANPTYAVSQGKHEYDGRFPDWSAQGIEVEIARLHRERDLATAFDTTRLDGKRRFQRAYLLGVVERICSGWRKRVRRGGIPRSTATRWTRTSTWRARTLRSSIG